MKTQFLTTSISVLALSVAFSATSAAQTLDYTAMSDLFGEPVTAGATGAPQRASDVPATMIIITQDDIERFPEYDIPGVLRHFAGVNFNRYAFGDGQVSIRGAATPYTPRLLVLVNGREVYLDSYGYTAWSSLPVEMADIQQIEVVKGPQSALYGFNAVAGVVNIITRNPAHGDYATARAEIGTDEYSNVSLSGGRQFTENFSARFSYGTQEGNEFAPYAPNAQAVGIAAAGNQFSRENAAIAATFRFNDKVSMNAEVTTSDVTLAETGSIYLAGGTEYDLNSYQAGLEADTDFGFLTFFASAMNPKSPTISARWRARSRCSGSRTSSICLPTTRSASLSSIVTPKPAPSRTRRTAILATRPALSPPCGATSSAMSWG